MMAYIPRWRGEAAVVVPAGKVPVACVCLLLKAMAATRAQIWKGSRTDHERNGFATKPHTPCLELNCILSPLAALYVVDTFFKIINQILVATQVPMNSGVMTWYLLSMINL